MMSTAPRPREQPEFTRWLPALSLATSVVCGVAVALLSDGPLRFLFVGIAVLMLPGLAICVSLRPRDIAALGAITLGSSLATWTVLSQAMALLDTWHPYRMFLGVVIASGAWSLALVVVEQRTRHDPSDAAVRATRPVASRDRSAIIVRLYPVVVGAAAIACFVVTVRNTDPTAGGDAGLVTVLPTLFFVGFALALGGFVLELFRESPRQLVLAWFVLIVLLLLFGTAPAIDTVPRYAWTYKHVGVAEYIQTNGKVDRTIDIYQNWPGFFALAAFASEVSGVAILELARWAQLFFGLANALALTYLVTSLTADRRVRALTIMIFVLANWVGQDYFAPQALGFLLTLVLVGLALSLLSRFAPRSALSSRAVRMLTRSFARTSDVGPDMAAAERRGIPAPLQKRAIAVVLLLFLGVTVTHQLSPFMAVLIVLGLIASRRMRHRWLPVVMMLIIVGWIALAHDFFDAHPDLLRIRLSRRNVNAAGASDNYFDFSRISTGGHIVQVVSLAVCLFVWFTAGIGILRRLRSGFSDIEAFVLLAAPALFLAGNSYGGEGVLRVYLFSLPGAAFLVASALLPRRSSWQRPGARVATFGFLAFVAVGFTIAGFGRDQFNLLRPGEVAAARTFETSAAPKSTLTTLGAYWPYGSTARYPELGFYVRQVLVENREYVHRDFTADDADRIADEILEESPPDDSYVAASASQLKFITTYGLMPPGQYENLVSIIDSSPRFRRWLDNGDAIIWHVVPPVAATPAPPVVTTTTDATATPTPTTTAVAAPVTTTTR
jgi:hypothetical protein